MTNEEKELLIKDLCGRLPYGTICEDVYGNSGILLDLTPELNAVTLKISDLGSIWTTDIDNVKPYLRPMESMTEEEGERLEQIAKETLGDFMFEAEEDGGAIYHMTKWKTLSPAMFDYLNSIHIDYRGLIEIGLALEASENMYH